MVIRVEQPVQHWSMKMALEQIDKCAFECEGGPLSLNDAYTWLSGAARIGPEFWPGQGIYFEMEAEIAGKTLRQWAHFFIVGCQMASDDKVRYWTYSLSYDPPAPYHYGTVHYTNVRGDRLRLTSPEAEG